MLYLRRSSNRSALETISPEHCTEAWSCWTLQCSSVQYGHPSLQCNDRGKSFPKLSDCAIARPTKST